MIRLDLTPEQLQAVLRLVGERVSTTGEEGTALEQAERELALLEWEGQ